MENGAEQNRTGNAPDTLFAPHTNSFRKPLKYLVHTTTLLVRLVAPLIRIEAGVCAATLIHELFEVLRDGRCGREVLRFRVEVERMVGGCVGPRRGERRAGEGRGKLFDRVSLVLTLVLIFVLTLVLVLFCSSVR
jgi:hypothetical protein